MSSLQRPAKAATFAADSETPRRTTDLRLLLNLSARMSFASISTDMYLPALLTITRTLHTDTASAELTFSAF